MRLLFAIIIVNFSCNKDSIVEKSITDSNYKICPLISKHAVLQREVSNLIWGWNEKFEKINIQINDLKYTTKTNKEGFWKVNLEPTKAGGPYKLSISGKKLNVEIDSIYFGDVWICAGQSNMTRTLKKTSYKIEEPLSLLTHLSQLKIQKHLSESPTQINGLSSYSWSKASSKSILNYSALAYHFASELLKKEKIPIGIINLTYPDSRIEGWLSQDSPTNINTGKPYDVSSSIYNGMVYQLKDINAKGVLWYQGESNNINKVDSYNYRDKLKVLIEDFRELLKSNHLPFLIIGLPNYESIPIDGNVNWAILRESQESALKIKNVGLVNTLDIGETQNLHPNNKHLVGKRAAKLALKMANNPNKEIKFTRLNHVDMDSNSITLNFINTNGSLLSKTDSIRGFELITLNDTYNLQGIIKDSTVMIPFKNTDTTLELRYAWSNDPKDISLSTQDSLPISSFRHYFNH